MLEVMKTIDSQMPKTISYKIALNSSSIVLCKIG